MFDAMQCLIINAIPKPKSYFQSGFKSLHAVQESEKGWGESCPGAEYSEYVFSYASNSTLYSCESQKISFKCTHTACQSCDTSPMAW